MVGFDYLKHFFFFVVVIKLISMVELEVECVEVHFVYELTFGKNLRDYYLGYAFSKSLDDHFLLGRLLQNIFYFIQN